MFSGLGTSILVFLIVIALMGAVVFLGPIMVVRAWKSEDKTSLDTGAAWNSQDQTSSINPAYASLPDARLLFTIAIGLDILMIPMAMLGGETLAYVTIGLAIFGLVALISSVVLAFVRGGPGTRIVRRGGSLILALMTILFMFGAFSENGFLRR